MRTRRGRYWPTPEQTKLLRAALLDGDAALIAWRDWKATADLDRLDSGSERLLPLLAHNLTRCGVRDLQLGRHAGIQQYTLVRNRRRLARVSTVTRALHQAGVPAMLLKGMALARHYYAHAGLRPMDDVDLLVPTADARRGAAVLRGQGWRAVGPEADIDLSHSQSYADADGFRLDLHWHALWEACGADADDEVWASADPVRVDEAPIHVIAPAPLLLQVIVHGSRWNAVSPVRWIADAFTIVSKRDRPLDWDGLVTQAARHDLVLPVREAIGYLVETFAAQVPAATLQTLEAYRPSAFERVEQRMRQWTSPGVGCFPLVLCHHVRLARESGALEIARRLPGYLQRTYGLPTMRRVPAALAGRAARRLRGRAVSRS